MITRRFDLTDRQSEESREFLLGQKGRAGRALLDTKLFVNAVIWRYRTSNPWKDTPEVYGNFRNIHKRYRRWYSNEIWKRIFDLLSVYADNDATIAKVYQHSAGVRQEAIKKTYG